MIGEILTGVSVIGSLIGTLGSARANRNITGQINKRQSELQTWYDREYNTNYLDTEEAKSTIQILRDQLKEQMKKVDQSNVIRGASDEARVATAERLNKGLGQNITQLAGYGTRYKDMIRREYQGLKQNLDILQLENLQNKSQQWSNLSNNAMKAGVGFAEAAGKGAFDKWDDKIANWWKNVKNNQMNTNAKNLFDKTGPTFYPWPTTP